MARLGVAAAQEAPDLNEVERTVRPRASVARAASARAIRFGRRRAAADPQRPASVVSFAILALLIGLALCAAALVIGAPVARAAPGGLLWQRVYNGTGNGEDVFTALAPAPSGGVYVAGYTFTSSEDFVAARYGADGQRRWLRTYNGTGDGFDQLTAAAADGKDLVVVGYSPTVSGSVVTLIIKYSPGGKRLWVRSFGSSTLIPDASQSVAVDRRGNIFVAATEYDPTTSYNMALAKYSSSGVRRWVRRYTGPGVDYVGDLALDAAGDAYVTGGSFATATGLDALTIKYSAAGRHRWTRRYDDGLARDDFGAAIAVGRGGDVYVVGSSSDGSGGQDYLMLEYTSAGVLTDNSGGGGAPGTDTTYGDIALLSNGHLAVVGEYYAGATNHEDMLIDELTPAGGTVWEQTYNGPANLNDIAEHVAAGRAGAAFVVGRSQTSTGSDIVTQKFSSSGSPMWASSYSGAGADNQDYALLVVGTHSVYVAGSQQAGSSDDGFLLRYRP